MHDTVIRGGTIVDGTGSPAFTGDIAIDGDRIAQVGGKAGPGRREIRGRRHAGHPGLGRCPHPLRRPGDLGPGAGAILLARRHHHPVRQLRRRLRARCAASDHASADRPDGGGGGDPRHRPGRRAEVGLGKLPANISTRSTRMPRTIDIAAQVPHHPLRVYVMGERAINLEAATAEDIDAMRRLTRGGDAGRRLRLHHLPHQLPQDADRRDGAEPLFRGARSCSASAARSAMSATAPSA